MQAEVPHLVIVQGLFVDHVAAVVRFGAAGVLDHLIDFILRPAVDVYLDPVPIRDEQPDK